MAKPRRTKDNGETPAEPASVTAAMETTADRADAPGTGDPHERISARAYELYLARGGADGQDWEDWLAAEREIAHNGPRGERNE